MSSSRGYLIKRRWKKLSVISYRLSVIRGRRSEVGGRQSQRLETGCVLAGSPREPDDSANTIKVGVAAQDQNAVVALCEHRRIEQVKSPDFPARVLETEKVLRVSQVFELPPSPN